MNKKDIPNVISIARIILVIPIAYCLWNQNYLVSLILFFVGGISDGLDGFLARRYHWETELGVILDPMGDKLMMLAAYLLLGWHQQLPLWLVALVIGRDMMIVTGTMLYRRIIGKAKLKPLFISKLNTVLQILLVLSIMLAQVVKIDALITETFIALVAVTTVLSGFAYINEWGRRSWRILKGKEVN